MENLLKNWFFFICLFLNVSLIMANENTKNSMGVYIGGYFNLSGSHNGHVPSYYEKPTYEHPPSIIAGGYYERKLNHVFMLQAGGYFHKYKINTAHYGAVEDVLETTWRLTSIRFPITVKMTTLKNRIHFITGFDFGMFIKAEADEVGFINPDKFKYNIIEDMPSFDKAFVFGLGGAITIQNINIIIEGRYLYVLNDYKLRGIVVEKKNNLLFVIGISL